MSNQNMGGAFGYRPCKHNVGVSCESMDKCGKCGWNPAVEMKRKMKIRERREMRINAQPGTH